MTVDTRRAGILCRLRRGEDGFAMITVVTVLFVMTLLVSIMTLNANINLDQNRRARQILTALDAADGGLDRLVFVLGQTPVNGQPN